jgi:predicted Ser/Thr protein kinase
MEMANAMKKGVQTNRIYLFEGPPGSGKSTFLNNLINKLQEYTQHPEGMMLKTVWHLDLEKISKLKSDFWDKIDMLAQKYDNVEMQNFINEKRNILHTEKYFDISCPYNDHPILQIPKEYRKQFLDTIIQDKSFKNKLFTEPQYKWVFKEEPCHICSSIYDSLYDILKSPVDILQMLTARIYNFSRKYGQGISVYNPGDEICRNVNENQNIQNILHQIFNNDNIKYIYSPMAYTNNGVYAIMDLKENNIQRFKNLHSIISDGVHKIGLREEKIRTLFIGLINPEDKKHFSGIKSFQDRIISVKIPYVLDYKVLLKIYKYKFGSVAKIFLPNVFESFAKVIISTRLEKNKTQLDALIDSRNYPFLDENLLLLKMEIYTGNIPNWLTDKDKTKLTNQTIENITSTSSVEGLFGISGRQSLSLFNKFLSKYGNLKKFITIDKVIEFFEKDIDADDKKFIPTNFLEALENFYDFNVLQEVKDSIYFYNREQISRDILNYLYAINFEPEQEIRCPYTGDKFVVNEDFLKNFEAIYLGTVSKAQERLNFRKQQQKEYVSQTLAQEINLLNKKITQTTQFKRLFIDYTTNLKQNALVRYIDNKNFRNGLKDFGTKDFNKYEIRLKNDIQRLIQNMKHHYHYSVDGAIEATLHILNKKIF